MKRAKKTNISIRRRIAIYYNRFVLLIKLSLLTVICLFFFTDLFKVTKNQLLNSFYVFSSKHGFALQQVELLGNKNLSTKYLKDNLGADIGTPIFAINLKGIKHRLEKNIWVKNAIVERNLPSKITVFVTERDPIAIWQFEQKLYIIDSEGNLITQYKNQDGDNDFDELLHVVGPGANIYAQGLIESLDRYPELASKVVSAVRHGKRRWDLNIDQEITIKMPEDGFGKAYDYLHALDRGGKLFNQNYKTIDLRDPDKYYLEKY